MDELIKALRGSSQIRLARKGSNILFQGEIPRRALIVRDGIVRSYMITSGGEERTLALHGRGEILPLSWILGNTPGSLFYYDALSDARLLSFSKDDLSAALAQQPELYRRLLDTTVTEHTSLLLRIAGLEQSRAIEKIGLTLYYLLFRHSTETLQGTFRIDVKISQSMLATLTGLTRESTAKSLSVFKQKSIISYKNSIYTVDKQRLEQFLGEDAFRELTL